MKCKTINYSIVGFLYNLSQLSLIEYIEYMQINDIFIKIEFSFDVNKIQTLLQ